MSLGVREKTQVLQRRREIFQLPGDCTGNSVEIRAVGRVFGTTSDY